MTKTNKNKGFTLLEILLVIAAIGILAAIVLVAINPNKQIEAARNAKRKADINTITKAIQQYSIDNSGQYPSGIETGAKAICRDGTPVGCIDLGILVPDYIASIPESDSNNYYIRISNNNIEVSHPRDNIWNIGGVPSLDLNFAKNKSLIDSVSGNNLITFTRNSIGTYVGEDGLIKTAGINEPRFDHNPVTGESLGLLVEEQRTNSLRPSGPISATLRSTAGGPGNAWFRYSSMVNSASRNNVSGLEVTPNTTFGTQGYEFISNNGWAGIGGGGGFSHSSTVGTFSFFINPLTWTGNIYVAKLATDGNPNTGEVLNFPLFNNGNFVGSSSIVKGIFPDGTYWINVNWSSLRTSVAAAQFPVILTTTLGDGVKKFWAGGFQWEAGSFSTSYIPTSGSAVIRSADNTSITGTNFNSWYNQGEGTFYSKGDLTYSSNSNIFRTLLLAGGFPNRRWSWNLVEGINVFQSATDGMDHTSFYSSMTPNLPNNFNIAQAIKNTSTTNVSSAADGIIRGSRSDFAVHNVNNLLIGTSGFTGHIFRLTYWPNRLPNSTLQAITQ